MESVTTNENPHNDLYVSPTQRSFLLSVSVYFTLCSTEEVWSSPHQYTHALTFTFTHLANAFIQSKNEEQKQFVKGPTTTITYNVRFRRIVCKLHPTNLHTNIHTQHFQLTMKSYDTEFETFFFNV